ncbi:uncharacterized protein [Haliotis asinina]|uniref:uncharacterized protein n=1 Tax=Haliotis asinina TaxID=109174 RepID=UPI003531DF7C
MTTMMLPLLLLALPVIALAVAPDAVHHNINTQAICNEVTRDPIQECVWPAGLNPFADQIAEGGRIIAYRIQWFSGAWSGWYVPGYNDLDNKINLQGGPCDELPYGPNSMRRKWASFYDHRHTYIICKAA